MNGWKTKKMSSSSRRRQWVDDLIVLGVGALAVYFFVKLMSSTDEEKITRCPHCGSPIKKWAITCSVCRRRIRTSPI